MTAALLRDHRITHLSSVPLTYRRLVDHSGDDSLLRMLEGGVVGGAPVIPSLAALLASTRLRVGYGLTEASPGLALGQPGTWAPYYLGLPVGCRLRVTQRSALQFSGPNACLGFWSERRLHRLDPCRWVDTGDLVDIRQNGLFFRGRSDDRFKLENGRWIQASACEERLRRRLPAIDESLVFSPDSRHLALVWSSDRTDSPPDMARLRAAVGPPGALLRWAVRIPASEWPRTPKGSIDRRLTEGRLFALLGCAEDCLEDRLHAAKGHPGQRASAAAILAESRRIGAVEGAIRPLQEIYSIRCAPQILGACRDQVAYARRVIEDEMNGVSDNPLLFSGETSQALHGGNFHGQHAAFAADALNAALTQMAILAERQVDALLNPRINGGAPPLLAAQPGPMCGLAGTQLTATAVVAEMRLRAQAIATFSIPTNGGNQDVVPMANLAARAAYAQTGALASVLAILGMSLAQLAALRREGLAAGRAAGPPPWMPAFAPMLRDRPVRSDVRRIARAWLIPMMVVED